MTPARTSVTTASRGAVFVPRERPRIRIRPVELAEANRYVAKLHRHHPPVPGHRFSVAAWVPTVTGRTAERPEGQLGMRMVGVAIVGRPVARKTAKRQDVAVLEVTRCCTDGTFNACSALYGAVARAGAALGYDRVQTFLLEGEDGASLRAAGWRRDGETPGKAWKRDADDPTARQLFLSGSDRQNRHPIGPKVRWVRDLKA